MKHYRSIIGGSEVPGGTQVPNTNPSDTSLALGVTEQASAEDVDAAVAAANSAQPAWASLSGLQRHDVLLATSEAIMRRKDKIAHAISSEEGKIISEGYAEAERARRVFQYFAAEAMRNVGDHVDSIKPGAVAEIVHEPVGVVGMITPWNFPFAIPSWKVAPALAFGNTVVMKASTETPWTGILLAEVLKEAGLPDGAFNLLLGSGSKLGGAMVAHGGLAAISFTGSTETGRQIAGDVAGRLAKVQLEMGGKNPMVVMDDADIPTAVNCAMAGLYFGTGQKCTSSSRFIVQDGIHDAFVEALCTRLSKTKVGHALDNSSEIGPVANEAQFKKDLSYIELGLKEGARLAIGGQPVERETKGFFLSPALFVDATPDMRIAREEIFGPVATVTRVPDFEEALQQANDTEYGLSAGICTASLKHASAFKKYARAGVVTVNLPTSGGDFHIAFGGIKASGYGGKEQGQYARDFFTQIKSCYTLPV